MTQLVHAELPAAALAEGSVFGDVNLKVDCLDMVEWGGGVASGWKVHSSTKEDLICGFCTNNGMQNKESYAFKCEYSVRQIHFGERHLCSDEYRTSSTFYTSARH